MAKLSALKLKRLFATLVSCAFALAALFMSVSMYGDITAHTEVPIAMFLFKAFCVGASAVFCAANARMAALTGRELEAQQAS